MNVDYRLGPEVAFLDRSRTITPPWKWLHASAGSLGVDLSRVAVMGESAGGGHAAMLTIGRGVKGISADLEYGLGEGVSRQCQALTQSG